MSAEQNYRDAWQRVVDIHGTPTCVVCASTSDWTVHGGAVVPVGDMGGTFDPNLFTPMVKILCMRCGNVLFFDLAHFILSER